MRIKTITILSILICGFAWAYWDLNHTPPIPTVEKEQAAANSILKATAPNPAFTSIHDKTYALHDFKGKTIIVNFWATWCAPCIAEFPELLQLASNRPDDLVVIALSVDETPQNINGFIAKLDDTAQRQAKLDNFIIAHDKDKIISQDMFQTVMYPESFIIDQNLIIQEKIAGFIEWSKFPLLQIEQ